MAVEPAGRQRSDWHTDGHTISRPEQPQEEDGETRKSLHQVIHCSDSLQVANTPP